LASALAFGGSAALAADLPAPEVPMIAAAPVVWSWTGGYAGLFIGTGFNGDIDGHHNKKSADDLSGIFGGGYLGYNWQMDGANLAGGGFVLGAETDIGFTGWSADGGSSNNKNNNKNNEKFDAEVGFFGSVRGRVGLGWDRFLIYGTGGWAYADIDANYHGNNKNNKNNKNFNKNSNDFLTGYAVGGGAEWAVTDNVVVRFEYLYYNIGEVHDGNGKNKKNNNNNNKKDEQFNIDTVKLGVAYKFGTY
jgi:outer membrane immunogenic protein